MRQAACSSLTRARRLPRVSPMRRASRSPERARGARACQHVAVSCLDLSARRSFPARATRRLNAASGCCPRLLRKVVPLARCEGLRTCTSMCRLQEMQQDESRWMMQLTASRTLLAVCARPVVLVQLSMQTSRLYQARIYSTSQLTLADWRNIGHIRHTI